VLALVLLPGAPVPLALAAGAVVSLGAGSLALTSGSRAGRRGGSSERRRMLGALLAAHAVAAVPIGLAVLLAG
jgi:hypothetical protein